MPEEKNYANGRMRNLKILQPVSPTMLDRQQATWDRMNTQGKTGQAVLNDADDDLNYISY